MKIQDILMSSWQHRNLKYKKNYEIIEIYVKYATHISTRIKATRDETLRLV